jgi:dipeptidyl aminopeptidase/acylaminoacyl peptidase
MYAAVQAKGLPVAYLLFEGEQHGFRQAKNIRRALEAELAFYGRVFGFAPGRLRSSRCDREPAAG